MTTSKEKMRMMVLERLGFQDRSFDPDSMIKHLNIRILEKKKILKFASDKKVRKHLLREIEFFEKHKALLLNPYEF